MLGCGIFIIRRANLTYGNAYGEHVHVLATKQHSNCVIKPPKSQMTLCVIREGNETWMETDQCLIMFGLYAII